MLLLDGRRAAEPYRDDAVRRTVDAVSMDDPFGRGLIEELIEAG